jgi:hypothetical protein
MEQIELAEHSRVAIGTILAGFEPEPARFGPEPGHAVKLCIRKYAALLLSNHPLSGRAAEVPRHVASR